MKRINKSLEKSYPTAKLFLEDLEDIQTTLKSSREFEIKTEDYIFSSVEEFRNEFDNKKLDNIEITAEDPYISIELKKLWVSLYCESDDTRSMGIFYKLDSIISKTSRKPKFLYSNYNILFGSFILGVMLSLFRNNVTDRYLLVGLGAILFIWILWFSYICLFNSGEVVLAKRGNFKNFFSRNKDQVIVGVFVALITAMITAYFPILQNVVHSSIERDTSKR